MVEVFYDRRGKEKYADDVIPFEQKGYFAILVKDNRVLVTYPPQVSVPEFPGGSAAGGKIFAAACFASFLRKPV